MANADAVAITVDVMAADTAIISEFTVACLNRSASGPVNTSSYQTKLKPFHTVIDGESLKEYIMTMISGA